MREILFRAKTEPNCKDVITGKIIKNPKWIYGYVDLGYMHDCKAPLISDEKGNKTYKCQYETIGQFAGLTDKNGKKIFEGDIVKYGVHSKIGVVTFGVGSFDSGIYIYIGWHVREPDGSVDMNELYAYDEYSQIEVLGNIHDNPELLKEDTYEENSDTV